MNTYKLKDSNWLVATPIELSDSQRQSLKEGNTTSEIQTILDEQWKAVSPEVSDRLNEKLSTVKPIVKSEDNFVIVSCFIDLNNGVLNGILNYTLNGEYNQIRF